MDDVQVDVFDAEARQASFDLDSWVAVRWVELGSEEHLLAGHAAFAQALSDALFVAVSLCCVEMPITELERSTNGGHALGTVGDLPNAEPEQRDRVAVSE
jgi:hypothetical protein